MTLHEDIKKQIEQAFAAARVADVQVDCSNEISIIDPVALDKLIKQIPTRSLRQQSTPAVGRHRGVCHHITVPKASAQTLIDAALSALQKK